MRHLHGFRKLGRPKKHRKALLRNLTGALIKHGRIYTTVTRAKEVRKFADRMVTWTKKAAKKDDPQHERKMMQRFIYEDVLVDKALREFPQRFLGREGGYTRIVKTTFRKGDGAPMCYIEYLDREKMNPVKEETTEVPVNPTISTSL